MKCRLYENLKQISIPPVNLWLLQTSKMELTIAAKRSDIDVFRSP